MYQLLKKIICYFRKVEIYEKKSNYHFTLSKKYKFKIYKNLYNIKEKEILNYFKSYKSKKKRFKENCVFITLSLENNLVSSGWLYRGKKWKITEINYTLNTSNKFVIFDFITPIKFRGRGFYTKLLKLIRCKFKKQNILIYVLSTNKISRKAIIKSGFDYQYYLKGKLYE